MAGLVQIYNNLGYPLGQQGEITVGGVLGGQPPVRLQPDMFQYGSGIGLLCNIPVGSAADYDVEMSGSDPATPRDQQWWNKHDVLYSKTASAQSNLAYPVTMVRIFLRSLTGVLNFGIVVPDK